MLDVSRTALRASQFKKVLGDVEVAHGKGMLERSENPTMLTIPAHS
jgi:hypothetical protein